MRKKAKEKEVQENNPVSNLRLLVFCLREIEQSDVINHDTVLFTLNIIDKLTEPEVPLELINKAVLATMYIGIKELGKANEVRGLRILCSQYEQYVSRWWVIQEQALVS